MRLPLVRCVVMLALPLLVAPLATEAQPAGVHRVGSLLALPSSATTHLREAFRHGLRELGCVEGHNIVIEFRNAGGIGTAFPSLPAELVRLNVDVIVAAPDVSIQAAKEATRTMPIVMAVSLDDPVERGFVASLARPGGNITDQLSAAGVTGEATGDPQGSRAEALESGRALDGGQSEPGRPCESARGRSRSLGRGTADSSGCAVPTRI